MARSKYSEIEFAMIKDISDNLNRIMNLKGITQKEICIKTGLPKSTVSDYVNGKTLVSPTNLQKIADALEVKCRFVGFEWDESDCNIQEN